MNLTRTCLIGCFLGSLATSAFAEDGDDVPQANAAPEGQYTVPPGLQGPEGQYAVLRGLQGPAGMISARVLLDHNLSADRAGQPVSLAPDIFYSVTDALQLGLLHQGPMGWQARPGLGVCLNSKEHGCRKIYDNVGLDVMYGIGMGQVGRMGQMMHLSAHASLFVNKFDPITNLALGAAGKVHFGNTVALFADPKISIALSDRGTNNDDALFVPVELQVQVGAPMTAQLLTGISGTLSGFGDTFEVPVGVGLVHTLNQYLDLGARFSFDNLLGHEPQGANRADTRSLAILLNLRYPFLR